MRRIALIFFAAIFVPSLVLGFLALRTAGEQRVIIEQQAVDLYQNDTDALAGRLNAAILARQREFAGTVRRLAAATPPADLARDFGTALGAAWTALGVPFVVSPESGLAYPRGAGGGRDEASGRFLRQNADFLSNRMTTEVYPAQEEVWGGAKADAAPASGAYEASEFGARAGRSQERITELSAATSAPRAAVEEKAAPAPAAPARELVERKVVPQKSAAKAVARQASKLVPEFSDFQTATSKGAEGILARFVQNELELIFWARPPEANGSVFGIGIPAERIAALVRGLFPEAAAASGGTCLAVLDENARPVITSAPGFEAAWKLPFVASEIGEALPHWEAALYLLEPGALGRSARLVTLSLTLLIALALAAILAGGTFVAIDARRQLALAQKKTDFVSNVSHELKTPLTSIRMFAELLQQGRADDPSRRAKYLRIITLESERLTRLINNVLDFARIEKKHKNYHKSDADLFPVIERVWEAQVEHLTEAGFTSQWHADDPPYPVHADPDAISQVVVNLLSNAEKYSAERKDVTLHTWKENGSLCVAVLDRGGGIPAGEERKIFEAFYRCDDSLASGVQGSGLGLTLARRIAADHGGSIEVRPRAGGGSEFTLRLPLEPDSTS